MSYTIRFRGWDSLANKWLYGGFSYFEGFEDTNIIVFDCSPPDEEGHCENFLNIKPVDHKTVGQSTGLYDKHHKELFVGDIIKLTARGNDHNQLLRATAEGVIYESMGRFCVSIDGHEIGVTLFDLSITEEKELVGNIHEKKITCCGVEMEHNICLMCRIEYNER